MVNMTLQARERSSITSSDFAKFWPPPPQKKIIKIIEGLDPAKMYLRMFDMTLQAIIFLPINTRSKKDLLPLTKNVKHRTGASSEILTF